MFIALTAGREATGDARFAEEQDSLERSRFSVPRMDCAAEERLVRLALEGRPAVHRIDVDLAVREVAVYHDAGAADLAPMLQSLNLGAQLLESHAVDGLGSGAPVERSHEVRTLRIALGINAAMFLGESVGGYLADSGALIADSLDMFADAAVYGIALYGAGHAATGQRRAARVSGWLQLALAVGVLLEVSRRVITGSEPEPTGMMGVAAVALVANAICLWLLAGHRSGGAHMTASWIFTTNDVLANLGVIVGGVLVRATGSAVPDVVIGAAIGLLVLNGARRIIGMAGEAATPA
jgi:Co/Zn/Cd efflux system component